MGIFCKSQFNTTLIFGSTLTNKYCILTNNYVKDTNMSKNTTNFYLKCHLHMERGLYNELIKYM